MVKEGQSVSDGDVVLRIDAEAVEAEVAQRQATVRLEQIGIGRAEARAKKLERERNRFLRLFRRGLLDRRSLDTAQHELQIARIELKAAGERLSLARAGVAQARERLERTEVRAPLDGVVTALEVDVGETAVPSTTNIPGSRLMTIADPARRVAAVYVDEADIAEVQVGLKAEIVAVAYPTTPIAGVVQFIGKAARAHRARRGLAFLVRIRIVEPDAVRLHPGMSCRVEIITRDEPPTVAVPIQAVLSDALPTGGVRHSVHVLRGATVAKTEVSVGRSDDTHQQITEGIRAGDRVVTGPGRSLRRLRDGDRVRVMEAGSRG